MSIEAGRLRHEIRIEQLENLLDSNGEVIQDESNGTVAQAWVEVATVRAAIEPLSAREFIQSQATQSQITARVIIRFRDGLNAAMRLVHVRRDRADVIYNPHGFLADKESGLEYLTIPVSAGVSDSGQ
jgi:SPP1 family predicted phage head-tail adaptor